MRAYLDNVCISAFSNHDLVPAEQSALDDLVVLARSGRVTLVTSRESRREIERTTDLAKRERLLHALDGIPLVIFDHHVLGYSALAGPRGATLATNPIVTDAVDQDILATLLQLGLSRTKRADAHHLMYAIVNECDRFVTTDRHFHSIRHQIHQLFTIRIFWPTELVTDLRNLENGGRPN